MIILLCQSFVAFRGISVSREMTLWGRNLMSFSGCANHESGELDEKTWLSPANQARNSHQGIKSVCPRTTESYWEKSNEFQSFSNINACSSGISVFKLVQKKSVNESFHLPKKKKRFTIESSFIEQAAHMYLKRAGSWENCNKDTND